MPFEDLTGTIVRKICMACSREFPGLTANCPHDGNLLVSLPQDQWEGKRLADRYKIDKRLGTGGMGVVYLAWHELMERWVAIKMLKSSFIEDELSVKRFQQEAKAASRLKHPNVITLHDFGLAPNGQPYMVMDYLVSTHPDPKHVARGLSQEIKDQGQLSVEKCIHVLAQACEALEHAHRQGVIHRDVKPANIMIVPNAEDPYFVKVVDFGVAKLLPINSTEAATQGVTQVGEVCGSPVYMSPEQCMGQSLDPRADIYSMGIVAFESLTGRLPLVGKNMVETMAKHMNETPPDFQDVRPDLFIPERMEKVVMTALQKSPHARQQSMAELANDLRFSIPRAGQTPSLKTHEITPLTADEDSKAANWMVPAGIAAVVVALASAMFFTLFGNKSQNPQPAQQPPAQQAPSKPATTAPVTATKPVTPPTSTTPSVPTTTAVSPTVPTAVTPTPVHQPTVVAHTPAVPEKPHVTSRPPAPKKVKVIGDVPRHSSGGDPFEQLRQLKSDYRGQ